MKYTKIDIENLNDIKSIIGNDFVYTDNEKLYDYSHDETEDLSYKPEIVVKPSSTNQVSKLVNYCNIKIFLLLHVVLAQVLAVVVFLFMVELH